MLYAAVLLDVAVSAVVVCKNKSVTRNQFPSAAAAEEYDGVFK